jgi:hypothetical protein
VEAIADDPGLKGARHGSPGGRPPRGRSGDLDPGADLGQQRRKPALDHAALAAEVEHFDHALAIQVRDDRRELLPEAMMGLVQ